MSKQTRTLYRMTADHTGEQLHVLLQDGHSSLPSVLGPMTPIEVDAGHLLWMTENERWLHQCNLMDRGWTVLGSQHALV